jgi:hypothetical protein
LQEKEIREIFLDQDDARQSLEDDFDFGGFWYVNFANLEEKNLNLVQDIESRQNRANSL